MSNSISTTTNAKNNNWTVLTILLLTSLMFAGQVVMASTFKQVPADIQICNTLNITHKTLWTPPTVVSNCSTARIMSTHQPGDVFPLGDTKVIYYAFDDCGVVDIASFTVTVLPNPEVIIEEIALKNKASIELKAQSESAISYEWSSGQNTTSIMAHETDAFQVKATNEEGCEAVATIFVNVKNPLKNPIEGANAQASKFR